MDVNNDESNQLDPSTIFTKSIIDQIQKGDVLSMVEAQREMLTRFEKTNEMLINFNMLSSSRYDTTMLEFKQHTNLLFDMKKDLDAIFRRIRLLKGRLTSLYPQAFSACGDVYYLPEENGQRNKGGEQQVTETEQENEDILTGDSNRTIKDSATDSKSLLSEQKTTDT